MPRAVNCARWMHVSVAMQGARAGRAAVVRAPTLQNGRNGAQLSRSRDRLFADRSLQPETCVGCAGRADDARSGGIDAVTRCDGFSILKELEALRQQVQQQQLLLGQLSGRTVPVERATVCGDRDAAQTAGSDASRAREERVDGGRPARSPARSVDHSTAQADIGQEAVEEEPAWLTEAAETLARERAPVAAAAAQDAELLLSARRNAERGTCCIGGQRSTAAARRRGRWLAVVRLQRAWRQYGGDRLVARVAGRATARAMLWARRMATEQRLQAHWELGVSMRVAAQRVQRWWRWRRWLVARREVVSGVAEQAAERRRARRRDRVRDLSATRRRERDERNGREGRLEERKAASAEQRQGAARLTAFWAAVTAQVDAARRLQCWLRGRLLAARVAGRRRQLEAARLGREILARLAAAHEARLERAGDGAVDVAREPGEPRLSGAERREDARAWAAAELRRRTGVAEDVLEARLQRQRLAYEERLRGEARVVGARL